MVGVERCWRHDCRAWMVACTKCGEREVVPVSREAKRAEVEGAIPEMGWRIVAGQVLCPVCAPFELKGGE